QPGQDATAPGDGAAPGSDLPDDATMALFLPALADPETRTEPVTDPYAIGPDAHDRTPDEGAARTPDATDVPDTTDAPDTPVVPDAVADPEPTRADDPAPDRAEAPEPVTDKGLPKRTPKLTTPAAVPRPRTSGSVDADALRRRLGGFRRGAEAGRRDVEAEIADGTGRNRLPDAAADTTEEATGGTVEEASS
ncbi:two component sensor kinase, partial [Streptomyces coelicoflavus ZG0656]